MLKKCHKTIFACLIFFSHNINYKDREKTGPTGVLLKTSFGCSVKQKCDGLIDFFIQAFLQLLKNYSDMRMYHFALPLTKSKFREPKSNLAVCYASRFSYYLFALGNFASGNCSISFL